MLLYQVKALAIYLTSPIKIIRQVFVLKIINIFSYTQKNAVFYQIHLLHLYYKHQSHDYNFLSLMNKAILQARQNDKQTLISRDKHGNEYQD